MKNVLYFAFFLSGVAGLIYESIWSRYLGLLVGHTAYAQVIVLTIFLGGLTLGAILVGTRSERMVRPLFWYAGAEALVGLFGLFFHDLFLALQTFAYDVVFPAFPGSPVLTPIKWVLVAGLILPPSVLLGTTFPLMSAGFLRVFPLAPGRVLSLLYFTNSFGAALGALLAGFVLLGYFGLPGTVMVAAVLNMTAALLAWGMEKRIGGGEVLHRVEAPDPDSGGAPGGETSHRRPRPPEDGDVGHSPTPTQPHATPLDRKRLWRLFLAVSFGTAVASFIYEIAWIRMLSLVLGTATHSFELMLSAFILGLALGAFWMRKRADVVGDPVHTLGWIQWIMGAAALATLPVYMASFHWTAELLSAVNRTPSGYALFNLSRYGMALLVMLPATFCAGTTLPLITRTLLTSGEGERAIGWVYGVNTLGSILAVVAASLLLLPLLGLKLLLILGGGLDMALGVLLLTLAGRGWWGRGQGTPLQASVIGSRASGLGAALGASAMVLLALFGVRMDRVLLSSGVYRTGRLPGADTELLFYRDGRTATVTADRRPPGVLTLSTNGKPDATLTEGWLQPPPDQPIPLSLDEPTQTLLALVTLAHNPRAEQALVVGQGSGLSSHMLLGSPHLISLTTVEIEPEMLEGSRVFLPATRRVFEDPRAHFAIDDAKSFLAQGGPALDLILSEPSNPWVSGVASLFSDEFYARVRDRLAPGGVFGQWIHLYEINDDLILSVLGALHRNFPSYQIFLVHSADMLIVAGRDPVMPRPDWGVFEYPDIVKDLARTFPFDPVLLEASRFLNREAMAPVLDRWPTPNSDFYPILDLGAERARFLQLPAGGFLESASGPFDLADIFLEPVPWEDGPGVTPVPQIPMGRALTLRNRIRAALSRGEPGGMGLETDLPLKQALYRWQAARALMAMEESPVDWLSWLREVLAGGGWAPQTGWAMLDPAYLSQVRAAAVRLKAPAGALAAVDFLSALFPRDWGGLQDPSDILVDEISEGRRWIRPDVVLDAGVASRIALGQPESALAFYRRLSPFSGRSPRDLRSRILRAHLDRTLSVR